MEETLSTWREEIQWANFSEALRLLDSAILELEQVRGAAVRKIQRDDVTSVLQASSCQCDAWYGLVHSHGVVEANPEWNQVLKFFDEQIPFFPSTMVELLSSSLDCAIPGYFWGGGGMLGLLSFLESQLQLFSSLVTWDAVELGVSAVLTWGIRCMSEISPGFCSSVPMYIAGELLRLWHQRLKSEEDAYPLRDAICAFAHSHPMEGGHMSQLVSECIRADVLTYELYGRWMTVTPASQERAVGDESMPLIACLECPVHSLVDRKWRLRSIGVSFEKEDEESRGEIEGIVCGYVSSENKGSSSERFTELSTRLKQFTDFQLVGMLPGIVSKVEAWVISPLSSIRELALDLELMHRWCDIALIYPGGEAIGQALLEKEMESSSLGHTCFLFCLFGRLSHFPGTRFFHQNGDILRRSSRYNSLKLQYIRLLLEQCRRDGKGALPALNAERAKTGMEPIIAPQPCNPRTAALHVTEIGPESAIGDFKFQHFDVMRWAQNGVFPDLLHAVLCLHHVALVGTQVEYDPHHISDALGIWDPVLSSFEGKLGVAPYQNQNVHRFQLWRLSYGRGDSLPVGGCEALCQRYVKEFSLQSSAVEVCAWFEKQRKAGFIEEVCALRAVITSSEGTQELMAAILELVDQHVPLPTNLVKWVMKSRGKVDVSLISRLLSFVQTQLAQNSPEEFHKTVLSRLCILNLAVCMLEATEQNGSLLCTLLLRLKSILLHPFVAHNQQAILTLSSSLKHIARSLGPAWAEAWGGGEEEEITVPPSLLLRLETYLGSDLIAPLLTDQLLPADLSNLRSIQNLFSNNEPPKQLKMYEGFSLLESSGRGLFSIAGGNHFQPIRCHSLLQEEITGLDESDSDSYDPEPVLKRTKLEL